MKVGPKAGIFLAGLLVGALLFAIAPVGAHHSDAKIKDRLTTLENKVKKLNKKTSLLGADGLDYFGFHNGRLVWMSDNTDCDPNDSAVWLTDPEYGGLMLACQGASPSAAPTARKALRR